MTIDVRHGYPIHLQSGGCISAQGRCRAQRYITTGTAEQPSETRSGSIPVHCTFSHSLILTAPSRVPFATGVCTPLFSLGFYTTPVCNRMW
ncbi:hypothetical protein BAUCODRAFT_201611 [Baudoinia panamericana UAMH 10762]|uniref:Uncharacterized protein n=1 Tax=Baudoinia panamericana (strain UAMH 10762) TaxID=717646 RepID=M2NAE3_BAUPA|nr:uncharacterized protein BAUCODRAFT_201611 [Baudoinia panamericana UAMH 10762]EMD01194.1 hypothetical protein BAUCODRAFT_201611 [Baudoinia panamericana UAMH 10762]